MGSRVIDIAHRATNDPTMRSRGVTLLEVLVSVAVIATLLAISIPALRSTQGAAREKQCLATLRSVGQASFLWANDHNDLIPHMFTPGQLRTTDPVTGATHNWFENASAWTLALRSYIDQAGTMCPWHPRLDPATLREHPLDENAGGSNYTLSAALYTNWAMWQRDNPATTPDQLRPVRFAEVAHPSNKSMYIEFIPFHIPGFDKNAYDTVVFAGALGGLTHGVNTVLADGSARSAPINTLTPGLLPPRAFRDDPDAADWSPFPLTTTIDGFLGRDF